MWCHMKHFVVENPGCFLMRLGVLSHFMVSRAAYVVRRSSDASSPEVPQVTKTILMAASSFGTPPPSHFSGIGIGPYPLPWMPHATDLAQMLHFLLFYFAARQTLRARVLLILCFSGSGGCARERKKMEKMKKCWIFHPNTHASGTRMSA
jgi:hypothetical protein